MIYNIYISKGREKGKDMTTYALKAMNDENGEKEFGRFGNPLPTLDDALGFVGITFDYGIDDGEARGHDGELLGYYYDDFSLVPV